MISASRNFLHLHSLYLKYEILLNQKPMGVVIESSVWESSPFLLFLFFCCGCFSIFLLPHASSSNRPPTIFDRGISSSFLRSLLSCFSVGWSMVRLGEFELASKGIGRELMVRSLCYGYASAALAGPWLALRFNNCSSCMRYHAVYPCLLGSRMLGSTSFPWLTSGPLLLRTEDCLVNAYIILGIVMSIVAYNHQVL